jgi:hypothetical protein
MRIKIYQINQDRDDFRVKLCNLKETHYQHQTTKWPSSMNWPTAVNPAIYDEVFDGEVNCKTLESVYTLFNTNHPPFHRGHSLSISDIVQITENRDNYLHGFFFCDTFGFEHIDFDPKQTHKPNHLLRVVAVEPGKPAYEAQVADKLRAFQQVVRGKIEVTYPFEGNAVAISNRDSKTGGCLDSNRTMNGEVYAGTFFIIGDGGNGNFCSLTDDQAAHYLAEFNEPELFGQQDADEDMDSGIRMT